MFELKFSDVGEGLTEAEILKWFVKNGDKVNIDDPIVEVQTDKASVEITSPKSGIIQKTFGDESDTIYVGDIIAEIETSSNLNDSQVSIEDISSKNVNSSNEFPNLKKSSNERIIAAPSVRKYAKENGINLYQSAKGKAGKRILKQDVDQLINEKSPSQTQHQVNQPKDNALGIVQSIPIKGLRKAIYNNMEKSAFTIPHATGMDEFHVDRLVEFRNSLNHFNNLKITFLPLIIKMVVETLKENPIFNSTINEESQTIDILNQYNIGIATATENGLVVPVIHQADQKSVEEIAEDIELLTSKARNGKLSPEDISNGTFTISSTGAKSGYFATPIINYPEVAILGIHSIKEKPVIKPNRELGIGHVMGMSLSFDHRVIDGEPAGKFMHCLKNFIENPETLLLKLK